MYRGLNFSHVKFYHDLSAGLKNLQRKPQNFGNKWPLARKAKTGCLAFKQQHIDQHLQFENLLSDIHVAQLVECQTSTLGDKGRGQNFSGVIYRPIPLDLGPDGI